RSPRCGRHRQAAAAVLVRWAANQARRTRPSVRSRLYAPANTQRAIDLYTTIVPLSQEIRLRVEIRHGESRKLENNGRRALRHRHRAVYQPVEKKRKRWKTAALETAAVLAPQLELLLYRTVEVQSGHQLFFLSSRLVCSPGMWTGGGMSLSRQP